MKAHLLACFLWSCAATDPIDDHIDPDRNRCEIEAELRGAECAVVYAFAKPWPNEIGHWEMCVPDRYLDDAQARYGVAWPSPRIEEYTRNLIEPPCFWCVSPGANALNGCFVPEVVL